jgi:hypothetical protein
MATQRDELGAAVADLLRWRAELTESSASSMLLAVAATMTREEAYWRDRVRSSEVQLSDAEQEYRETMLLLRAQMRQVVTCVPSQIEIE